jgi:hypothetical protein
MSLPDPKLNKKGKANNKLGIYKQADQDTARLMENRKQDPYYAAPVSLDTGRLLVSPVQTGGKLAGLGRGPLATDEQAEALLKKMDLLKGMLNQPKIVGYGPDSNIQPYGH